VMTATVSAPGSTAAGTERRDVDAITAPGAAVVARAVAREVHEDVGTVFGPADAQAVEFVRPDHVHHGHRGLDGHAVGQRCQRRARPRCHERKPPRLLTRVVVCRCKEHNVATVMTGVRVRRSQGLGLLLALGSAATFGSAGSFASALLGAGWSPGAAVLTRLT